MTNIPSDLQEYIEWNMATIRLQEEAHRRNIEEQQAAFDEEYRASVETFFETVRILIPSALWPYMRHYQHTKSMGAARMYHKAGSMNTETIFINAPGLAPISVKLKCEKRAMEPDTPYEMEKIQVRTYGGWLDSSSYQDWPHAIVRAREAWLEENDEAKQDQKTALKTDALG